MKPGSVVVRATAGGIAGFLCGALATALVSAMKTFHRVPGKSFDLLTPLLSLFVPRGISGWMQLLGVVVFGLIIALAAAATAAARSRAQRLE